MTVRDVRKTSFPIPRCEPTLCRPGLSLRNSRPGGTLSRAA